MSRINYGSHCVACYAKITRFSDSLMSTFVFRLNTLHRAHSVRMLQIADAIFSLKRASKTINALSLFIILPLGTDPRHGKLFIRLIWPALCKVPIEQEASDNQDR